METVTEAKDATVWHTVEYWSSFECRLEAGRVFPGWDMVPASFCPRRRTLQYQTRSPLEAAACFVENQVCLIGVDQARGKREGLCRICGVLKPVANVCFCAAATGEGGEVFFLTSEEKVAFVEGIEIAWMVGSANGLAVEMAERRYLYASSTMTQKTACDPWFCPQQTASVADLYAFEERNVDGDRPSVMALVCWGWQLVYDVPETVRVWREIRPSANLVVSRCGYGSLAMSDALQPARCVLDVERRFCLRAYPLDGNARAVPRGWGYGGASSACNGLWRWGASGYVVVLRTRGIRVDACVRVEASLRRILWFSPTVGRGRPLDLLA
ncbi:uncharacterized protein J3D65DRAFT_601280 [Phyllosticta citribraziliensis]|uniref:Uncharacterized protein n=1 Tax=Phyllosticta citribraziliensis TaxID=989973 RepID=A0ABR1M507_9PEZI